MRHHAYERRIYKAPARQRKYRSQGRGGKGVRAMTTKDEDFVETVFTASTHDNILLFTSKGRVFIKKGYNIPEAGRNARGTNIVNIIQIENAQEEKVSAMIRGRALEEENYLVFATRNGTVKRMSQAALKNIRANGIRALTLDEGDELISVISTTGDEETSLSPPIRAATCFNENDVRPMGPRQWACADKTERGRLCRRRGQQQHGQRPADHHRERLRQAHGLHGIRREGAAAASALKNYNVTEKTGNVADVKIVTGDEDVLVVTDDATIIRIPVDGISLLGRSTQGVRIMRTAAGSRVISIETTEKTQRRRRSFPARRKMTPRLRTRRFPARMRNKE